MKKFPSPPSVSFSEVTQFGGFDEVWTRARKKGKGGGKEGGFLVNSMLTFNNK